MTHGNDGMGIGYILYELEKYHDNDGMGIGYIMIVGEVSC